MNAPTAALAQHTVKQMAHHIARIARQLLAQAARPTVSERQSRCRRDTAATQNTWLRTAQTLNARQNRTGRWALHGYNVFL